MNERPFGWLHVLAVIGLLFLTVSQSRAQDQVTYAITNGTIIDGTGAAPIENGIVLVTGQEIVRVGDVADNEIPADSRIIDAGGGTILPGVINAHTHQVRSPAERFAFFTRSGVTGICDMAMPLTYMTYANGERIADGRFAGRFSLAGPIITVPGGYPVPDWGKEIGLEVGTPEEAEAAVLSLLDKGATHIKIALETGGLFGADWPVLSLAQIQAITRTAHQNGLMVHAHVGDAELLERAVDGGVDVIEHTPVPYDRSAWSNAAALDAFWEQPEGNPPIPDELLTTLRRMVEDNITLDPTLDVMVGRYRGVEMPPDFHFPAYEGFILGMVRAFHEFGGRIAVGNDYGNAGISPGMPLKELELLEEVGLTPLETITAATRNSAYACGMERIGTLEAGQYADLIIVGGNPLDDITAMANVTFVMVNGEIIVE